MVATMIWEINKGLENLGIVFDICIILSIGIGSGLYLLKSTIFWKLMSPIARGSILGLSSVLNGLACMLLQLYGSYLYDNVRMDGPFIICASFDAFCLVIGLLFWSCGKLKA